MTTPDAQDPRLLSEEDIEAIRDLSDIVNTLERARLWARYAPQLLDHIAVQAEMIPALTEQLAAELSAPWLDKDDEHTAAINAAHPTKSRSHAEYLTATQMIGNRRSKGALVDLVNWLLVSKAAAAKARAAAFEAAAKCCDGWTQRRTAPWDDEFAKPHPVATAIQERIRALSHQEKL